MMVSDDMLSQDEIDALLKGGDEDLQSDSGADEMRPPIDDFLTPLEQDALGEVGNISFGSSATALSTLLNQKVDITTPKVSVIQRNRLEEEFPYPYVAIQVNYTAGFEGMNLLVIKSTDAAIIADLMLGGDGMNASGDLGEIELSAVQEAMNQMMGSAATSMSTVFNQKVDISPPSIDMLNIKQGEGTENIPDEDILVQISFNLKVGNLIDSSIMQILPVPFAKVLVEQLLNPPEIHPPVLEEKPVQRKTKTRENSIQDAKKEVASTRQDVYPTERKIPPQTGPKQIGVHGQQWQQQSTNVQPAMFSSFDEPALQPNEVSNLNMLLDIPLQVTVELGRTKRSVQEILELSPGSIIELDKLAGEPVDILVNNKLVAKGEVVVIDENFGVRVTDIISQSERMKKLQ
jgi:flagellar motor switch protein FliN/FliY